MAPDEERIHNTWIDSDRFVPRRFMKPVRRFMDLEAAAGILMLLAAVAALVWANSPAHDLYDRILHTEFLLAFGPIHLENSFGHLINDGLMALFFFLVALEIKREVVLGDLRNPKDAALPVIAAIGGMTLPALIYLAFNAGDPAAMRGWPVPIATDIAFALGVLSVLGRRVPPAAKLFVLALAIADDLGGILVIAIFFSADLAIEYILLALAGLVAVWVLTKVGIRSEALYVPLGIAVWYFLLQSGVHATLAGVALGFLTPARPMYGVREFDTRARRIIDRFPVAAETNRQRDHAYHEALLMAQVSRESVAPLNRWEYVLAPWVSFVIVPLFALANAGVRFTGSVYDQLLSDVALGVGLGLVAGKVGGITLSTWIAVQLGVARLPTATSWRQMVGLAATAGIGFTVALFITALAYTDPVLTDQAKVGILAGSILAGTLGAAIFLTGSEPGPMPDVNPEQEEIRA